MRPFGCPVTILNTLDPLGKFQGKVDEGFLVRYSVCSKAFRVFNSRTQNQTNSNAGFQDTEKAEEEGTQTYVLFPVLSDGFTNPKNNNKDAHTDGKEHDDDIQKSESPDIHSSKFKECINNSSNGVNAAGSLVFAPRLNFINSTNDFSAAGPSNVAMPNLEDLSHNANDVGAEADINNMESIISVSHIPTTRIHKDHPTSQIIGDLSSTTQTRSMARAVRDQGGISQMFNEDFHTYGEDVDVHTYRSMIGSLMYLTSSRPDIMFADSPFDLVAYSDSDYACASLDRKSTKLEDVNSLDAD
nr:ribonuclease H-like domain-containing protein [Tanacetum cinerariifolium]